MATKTIEICDACGVSEERTVAPWSTVPVATSCAMPDFDTGGVHVPGIGGQPQRGGLRLGLSTFDLCTACATKAAATLGLDFAAKAKEQREERATAYAAGYQATLQALGFQKDGVPRSASVNLVGGALSDEDLAQLGLLTDPTP